MDYFKLNHVVTPIQAAVLNVDHLLVEVNRSSGTWYAAIDLADIFYFFKYEIYHFNDFQMHNLHSYCCFIVFFSFCMYINKDNQKQIKRFAFN